MSRKKKHPPAHVAATPVEIIQPVAAPGESSPVTHKQSSRWIAAATILVLMVGIAAIFYYVNSRKPIGKANPSTPSAEAVFQSLPEFDLQGAEPQVVEKILKLKSALKGNVSSAEAWGKLAMNLHVHDFKQESIACYREASALAPSDFRWTYYLAVVLQDTGSEYTERWIQQSIQLKPDYAPLHVRYGNLLFAARKIDAAAREYQIANEKNGNLSHALLGLGRVALARGKINEAFDDLRRAQTINPQHTEVHGLLAELYRRQTQPELAQRETMIAQQLPKETQIPDPLMGQWAEEGVSSYWYDMRGRAYLQNGNIPEAIQQLEMATRFGSEPEYFNTLGVAYMYAHQYEKAVAQHRHALELNPNSVQAQNNLAAALFELGQKEEAVNELKLAIQQHPEAPRSYLHLSNLRMRMGNPADAIRVLEEGYSRLPDHPGISLQLAAALATQNAGVRAAAIAEKTCRRTGCNDPQSRYVLALSYSAAGRKADAVGTAEQALELARHSGDQDLIRQIESLLKRQ